MGKEDEEGEEQVGGGAVPQEESRPDGEPAGGGEPVGGQEEGAAGADPAAAGGEEPARLHPGGSQVRLQQSLLGERPGRETTHDSRASSAGESRTRAPSEHGAPPHPRRGDGGEPAPGDGDDNSKIGSSRRSPETKTSLKPPRWQRVEQPEQPQRPDRDPDQRDEPARLQRPDGRQDGADPHEHSNPDHGEHDHPFQLGSAPDPNRVNTILWKPAKVWSERRDAGARESKCRSAFGLSMISRSFLISNTSEKEFKWKIMMPPTQFRLY